MRDMSQTRKTAFRSNEAAEEGLEEAIHKYTRGLTEPGERRAAAEYLERLIHQYGPVVEGYPSWHPFASTPASDDPRWTFPRTDPQGFEGLDHTICFRDAFITAPYEGADRVIKSAVGHPSGFFDAEQIQEVSLYHIRATPVLVICTGVPKESDGTISKRFALGRMLSQELPAWRWATCGESWKDMRRYLLGAPCGSRSSLFVNQDTGKALREVHEMLNRHQLWGPVRQ